MTTRRIPLFPLNTVLFPGMTLPLHIFEPRYQEMIRRCLESDRVFGVCLIASGPEVGGHAEPCSIGTTCEIVAVTALEGGRMNLTTVGRERFRVVHVFRNQDYLEAEVEEFTEQSDADAHPLAPEVREAAVAYIHTLLAAGGEPAPKLQLPEEPVILSYLVGAVLQIAAPVRQALLEERITSVRLERQLALLREETAKLAELTAERERRATAFRIDPERISLN